LNRNHRLILAAAVAVLLFAVVGLIAARPGLIQRWLGQKQDQDRWQVAARQRSLERLTGSADPASGVVLDEQALRNLFIVELAKSDEGRRLLDLAAEVEADVRDGRLRLGVLVDLSKVDGSRLGPQGRDTVQQVERLLSAFGSREIVLSIEGIPRAANGRIVFAPDETTVHIAFLELSVDDFAKRFGVDPARVGDRLSFALHDDRVLEVEVLPESLRLVLAPR
jgi:hypothetical protein